ncbi:unnamed protein product [Dicrocoelium dendriticum]|nr:unnamed protein product [Dicrocoelium dendriticum]
MVNIDASHSPSSSLSASEEEAYDLTEEFLLTSLLIFSLRKRFVKAAEAILSLIHQSSYRAPDIAKWCLAAMQDFPTPPHPACVPSTSTRTNGCKVSGLCQRLDDLIVIATNLAANLDQSSSSFCAPLSEYLTKARRLILHFHLESFIVSGDYAAFICELNRYFPAHDSDFPYPNLPTTSSMRPLDIHSDKWLAKYLASANGCDDLIVIAHKTSPPTWISSSSSFCATRFSEYLTKARRLILHFHLESFIVSGDYAAFICELNRYFPAHDSDILVRSYRIKFAKLLVSRTRTRAYLNERWIPHREDALKNLGDLAWEVAQQFPPVFFDKIGTSEWRTVDELLLYLNTAYSVCLREYFRDATECTEKDILEFAQITNTQKIPSQLF